jgi:hypothetical protein
MSKYYSVRVVNASDVLEVPIHIIVKADTQEDAFTAARQVLYFIPSKHDPIVTEPVDITEEN